jgi:peptidoglycan/LPS O-acetylase OafA/YrhL
VIVGAVLVVAFKSPARQHEFFSNTSAALLYYANYQRIFDVHSDSSWYGHVWSLSLEEQFYLLWPLCLLLVCRRARLRGHLPVLLLGAALSVLAWRWVLIATGSSWMRLYFGLDTRADALLIGCALAAFRHGGYRWSSSRRLVAIAEAASVPKAVAALAALGPLALLSLAACAVFGPKLGLGLTWFDRGGYTLVALLACWLVLAADVAPSGWFARLLASRPLSVPGRISYGFYLWHFPVTAILLGWVGRLGRPVAYGIAVVVSLGLASLSYRLVEQPAQRKRPAWASSANPSRARSEPTAPEHRAA